jgi:hypothetical protein
MILTESVIGHTPVPLIVQIYVVVAVGVTVGVANPGPVPEGGAADVEGLVLQVYIILLGLTLLPAAIVVTA